MLITPRVGTHIYFSNVKLVLIIAIKVFLIPLTSAKPSELLTTTPLNVNENAALASPYPTSTIKSSDTSEMTVSTECTTTVTSPMNVDPLTTTSPETSLISSIIKKLKSSHDKTTNKKSSSTTKKIKDTLSTASIDKKSKTTTIIVIEGDDDADDHPHIAIMNRDGKINNNFRRIDNLNTGNLRRIKKSRQQNLIALNNNNLILPLNNDKILSSNNRMQRIRGNNDGLIKGRNRDFNVIKKQKPKTRTLGILAGLAGLSGLFSNPLSSILNKKNTIQIIMVYRRRYPFFTDPVYYTDTNYVYYDNSQYAGNYVDYGTDSTINIVTDTSAAAGEDTTVAPTDAPTDAASDAAASDASPTT